MLLRDTQFGQLHLHNSLTHFAYHDFAAIYESCMRSGDQDLVVEAEWTGVLGFTLDGKPLAGAMPNVVYAGRVFVGAGYCGHGMPTCSGVGKALAQQMVSAEGHDVSDVVASDTASIIEYVKSLSPARFAQLNGVAASAKVVAR